jgi:hypothetical protein
MVIKFSREKRGRFGCDKGSGQPKRENGRGERGQGEDNCARARQGARRESS